MRDQDAARRLMTHYVLSMVCGWGRAGLRAASVETFTEIGTSGPQPTQAPRNRLKQDARIIYAAGEVATLAWADGTRELVPLPRRPRAWTPTVAGTITTASGMVLTFRIPERKADELAAITRSTERQRDAAKECPGGT